jgi:hypothetical protein
MGASQHYLGAAVPTESRGEADSEPYSQDLRERVRTSRKSNRHGFDVRATFFAPLGADLTQNQPAQPILAEVDRRVW